VDKLKGLEFLSMMHIFNNKESNIWQSGDKALAIHIIGLRIETNGDSTLACRKDRTLWMCGNTRFPSQFEICFRSTKLEKLWKGKFLLHATFL